MKRMHITMPEKAYKLFADYAKTKRKSVSAFMCDAALERISETPGEWAHLALEIMDPAGEYITKSDFVSLTRQEKERLLEGWR
jgi:hypothetical protein